jgi:hypothetical protein
MSSSPGNIRVLVLSAPTEPIQQAKFPEIMDHDLGRGLVSVLFQLIIVRTPRHVLDIWSNRDILHIRVGGSVGVRLFLLRFGRAI